MSDPEPRIEKRVHLSLTQAGRLEAFATSHHASEDLIVGRALDILFNLTDLLGDGEERRAWSALSSDALAHVWENDADAAYDNWRELYGVPAG